MVNRKKQDFINRQTDMLNNDKEYLPIEVIDVFCTEWLKKTPEKKAQLIREQKIIFKKNMAYIREKKTI